MGWLLWLDYYWHGQMIEEREVRKSVFNLPSLKTQIDPLLGKAKKFYASRFYQLKIEHGAIGTRPKI